MVPVSAGSFTTLVAFPDVHETVAGSPATAGFEEKVHVLALATVAERVTLPPVAGSLLGLTVNDLTVGFAACTAKVPARAAGALSMRQAAAPTEVIARRPRSPGIVMGHVPFPVPGPREARHERGGMQERT